MSKSVWGGIRLILVGTVMAACWAAVTLPKTSAQKDKAAFLSDRQQSFIRPGLVLDILSARVEGDGTVRYQFRITDPRGVPLDREGIVTPGAVSVSSVLAYIPRGTGMYRAYTIRTQTSPITGNSATQAAADAGGAFTRISDGVYEYRFNTRLPADYDRAATHTVAAWASRNLSEFDLGSYPAAKTFNWVPAGSAVTETRHIVNDQKCNACHATLVAHGSRTTIDLCITCHTPQTTDPDTGNTVDMTTMVHRIHQGEGLPSVQAGTPYVIIGNQQSVHDFSTVVYPADVRNCGTCHLEGDQGNQHMTNPSRRACGSCHDDVNFATGENHVNLPQVSDNQCRQCHIPEGELEFDASIKGAHTIERFSKSLPGVKFQIFGIQNTAPDQHPVVTFGVTDKSDRPLALSSLNRLALVLAGPVDSHSDNGPTISENALTATGADGRYTYTFAAAMPNKSTQTWTVGIEGYRNETLLPGTVEQRTVRDAGHNVVLPFRVTDSTVQARRQVVTNEKCNVCHYSIDFHGSNRNDVLQCVLCHNPTATDAAQRPADKAPAESINFKEMIHRIHWGEENTRDITIYGFGGSPFNFNEVRYPRPKNDCGACHVNGSEQLPLNGNLASADDPRGLINPAPPATGACLSCHASNAAAAHADVNISSKYGESCTICHGTGAEFAVDKVHAQ